MRRLPHLLLGLALVAGCDKVGGQIGRGKAVPVVAPPNLSPVEILPPHVNRTTQGQVVLRNPAALPAVQVDAFKQSNGVVDILWVVSNSGAMANERLRLGQSFSAFMQELIASQSDFHIAVTSTDPANDGQLIGTTKVITTTTPNPTDVFVANTTFPDTRVRWTEGLRMAQVALSEPNLSGPNQGFLRPNAALGVIVATVEDDESYGDPAYYTRFFRHVKGPGNENLVTFSTIGGTTPSGCYPPGDQNFYGGLADAAFRYDEVSVATGGVIASICDTSFQTTLVRIADAINTLRKVFPLSLKPDPSTITVTVNGELVPQDVVNGWTYQAGTNSIAFLGNFVPPPSAQIQIEYAIAS